MGIPARYSEHKNVVTLYPGECRVGRPGEEILLHTLLGSCVAACLYDPVADIVGMNHFLLSDHRYSKALHDDELKHYSETEAGRYGVHSMELLINKMLRAGAEKSRLQAKAFGGASVLQNSSRENFLCVGEANTQFIQQFLKNERIPLNASDLGGHHGRIIYFSSRSYTVSVRRLVRTTLKTVTTKEYRYWKDSITLNKAGSGGEIELWE